MSTYDLWLEAPYMNGLTPREERYIETTIDEILAEIAVEHESDESDYYTSHFHTAQEYYRGDYETRTVVEPEYAENVREGVCAALKEIFPDLTV